MTLTEHAAEGGGEGPPRNGAQRAGGRRRGPGPRRGQEEGDGSPEYTVEVVHRDHDDPPRTRSGGGGEAPTRTGGRRREPWAPMRTGGRRQGPEYAGGPNIGAS